MDLELTDDQRAFREEVRRFARTEVAPVSAEVDASNEFPRALVARAAALGLMGVTIPPRWGGAGRDYLAYALALEEVARASATLAVILSVNNSLVAEVIHEFGTDPQRERWLPALASGRAIGSFALSERDAGTDAANQHTHVRLDGLDFRLNGSKVWVANASNADVAVVFAASQPDGEQRGISAFLVPMDSPGIVRRRETIDSLGVRGLGCQDLDFEDVEVDSSQLLGTVGQGFAVAKWALDGGRVAIAAQALGVGEAALAEAVRYAGTRHTFGQVIGSYQAIQWMLADTATELQAARVLTWRAAAGRAVTSRRSVEAAMAKLAASEAAHRAADRALQVLAAAGYERGALVERLFRDARATEIYQGTSEVQRMVIAQEILHAPA